jgi:hypothetical protein
MQAGDSGSSPRIGKRGIREGDGSDGFPGISKDRQAWD